LIQGNVRESDTLGRYRTNEFLVLMPETASKEATIASERLLQDVDKQPISINNQVFHPSIRIGVTCLLDGHGDAAELIQSAQTASLQASDNSRIVTRVLTA
jgi:diguanylate cyclase (GGDEF)-like protein